MTLLDPTAAETVHYATDPRIRHLAEAGWRMRTGGSRMDWLCLGKDNPEALIAEAREWVRAAVAGGLLPAPSAAPEWKAAAWGAANADEESAAAPREPDPTTGQPADQTAYARGIRDAITEIERKAAGVIPRLHRMADQAHPPTGQAQAATATARAAEFSEMETARRSFPDGVRPALCKALAAVDQRTFGRLPIPERRRYTEQADAVLRLMGWRETQLARQYQDTLKALRATEADRAAILREAATAIDAAQAREEATAQPPADRTALPADLPPVARALTDTERKMLSYALDRAQERIWGEGGVTAGDEAAITSLRRMAAEAQPPADQTVLRDLVAATLREHGTVHLGDQVPADEYDCCADAVLAVLPAGRVLYGTADIRAAVLREATTPETAVALTDGPVRCPLCPTSVTLHTPNGARAHFTHVHPEQRITGRGLGPWPLIVTNAVEAQQQDELLAQPQSCRSDTGITVGLVDSLITTLRVLAPRDLSPGPVQEALTDLTQDPDLDTVLRALSRRQDTEAQQQDQDPPAAEAHPAEELRAAAAKLGPSSPAVAAHTVAVRLHPDVVAALADLLVAVSYNPHDGSMDDPGTDRHDHCDRTVCIPAAALMAARVINREAQR